MRRAGVAVAALAALAALASATGAQAPAVTVAARPAAAADPARPVTLVAVLANAGARAVTATPALHAPAAWRVLGGTDPVAIPAGGRATWIASVLVPAGTPAGRHAVHAAFALDGPAQRDTLRDTLVVVVAAQRALALRVLEPLPAVAGGETARAVLRLENRGNVRAGVRLAAHARLVPGDAPATALAARLDVDAPLSMAPGESRLVTVAVPTPAVRARVAALTLDVRATAADARADERGAEETLRTSVVPDASGPDARAAWVPVRALVRAGSAYAGAPLELAGGGAVGRGVAVDVLARGPRAARGGVGAFGERPEYRLAVRAPHARLTLGHQLATLTPLTEPGRFAVGAGARAERGTVAVDVLAARDDGWGGGGTLAGGGATVRARPGVELGAFGVHRGGADAGGGRAASLRAAVRVDSSSRLTLETAAGAATGARALGRADHAELTVDRARGSVAVRHVARAAAYPGPMRGTRDDAASVRLRIVRGVQLDASAADAASDGGVPDDEALRRLALALGTEEAPRLVLPRERRREAGAGVRIGGAVRLAWHEAERAGTSGTLAYAGRERTARLQAGGQLGAVRLSGSGELGSVADARRGATGAVRRADGSLAMQLGDALWLAARAEVRRGPTLWSGPGTTMGAGLDLRARLADGLTARLSATASDQRALLDGLVPVDGRVRLAVVDAAVERALPGGRTLALRARGGSYRGGSHRGGLGASGGQGTRALALEYGLPLRLPAWRAPRTRQVVGRLVDHETGRGIARALVQLDDVPDAVAMTDAAGRVRFRDVAPGEHRLTLLDGPSVAGRVAADPAALRVTASERPEAPRAVALVRGARLVGRACRPDDDAAARALTRQAAAESAPSSGGGAPAADGDPCAGQLAVAGALVAVAGARDTVHVVTDARGAFTVDGLRPGRWAVRVADATLPAGLVFAGAGHVVELAAGRDATLRLAAVPRARTVRPLRVAARPER